MVHSVHFYDTDEALIQRLAWIVFSGFDAGVSALLIITPEHEQQFKRYMQKRGVDPLVAEREGRLFILNAQQTLNSFMRNGMPDADLFAAVVGALARPAGEASKGSGLTAFGEMVAILWQQGNREGALALESMWNELLERENFHLHCAYPKSLFQGPMKQEEIFSICLLHSVAVGHEAAA